MERNEQITCPECQSSWKKDDLGRSCCNCFCCTGCEIYICDNCRNEIIIHPIGNPPDIKHNKE